MLIWNVASRGSRNHVEFILQGHKRAVSDVHWSPFHSDVLATCSYDTYIHLWDMRISTEKPCNSFCAWTAGATQVKWNRLNEWIFASSHDTDARIWDIRKGSSSMTLITAHMKKVYGIDWSRIHERELITCSQDGLVKVFFVYLSCLTLGSFGITRNRGHVRPRSILDPPFGELDSHLLVITL